jgi:ABC-type hemin transport system ATPase subunit
MIARVSHDLVLAARFAENIVMLKQGRVLASGSFCLQLSSLPKEVSA